jgi:hypothetical protein
MVIDMSFNPGLSRPRKASLPYALPGPLTLELLPVCTGSKKRFINWVARATFYPAPLEVET